MHISLSTFTLIGAAVLLASETFALSIHDRNPETISNFNHLNPSKSIMQIQRGDVQPAAYIQTGSSQRTLLNDKGLDKIRSAIRRKNKNPFKKGVFPFKKSTFVFKKGPFKKGTISFKTGNSPFKTVTFPLKTGAFPFKTGAFPFKTGTFPFKAGTFPFKAGTFPFNTGTFPFKAGTFPFKAGTFPFKAGTFPFKKKGFPFKKRGLSMKDLSDMKINKKRSRLHKRDYATTLQYLKAAMDSYRKDSVTPPPVQLMQSEQPIPPQTPDLVAPPSPPTEEVQVTGTPDLETANPPLPDLTAPEPTPELGNEISESAPVPVKADIEEDDSFDPEEDPDDVDDPPVVNGVAVQREE